MFGTDASTNNLQFPQQDLMSEMFQCCFRFLKTADDHFDYPPTPITAGALRNIWHRPSRRDMKKVYHNKAAKLMGWDLI